jgi:uncharacterized LabA/DUF88 family protein
MVLSSSIKANYAFIDSQNLNLGIKSAGWKLDYQKFRLYLKNKYNVEEAFLFIGHLSGNESLYTSLQRAGYILVFKPTLEIKKDGKTIVKGNVDAELVLHTMLEINNFDKAIIVSGDGDFHCLIEYLVESNKLLRLLAPNNKYSSLLRKFHKYIALLDGLRGVLGIKPKKKTKISVRSKP